MKLSLPSKTNSELPTCHHVDNEDTKVRISDDKLIGIKTTNSQRTTAKRLCLVGPYKVSQISTKKNTCILNSHLNKFYTITLDSTDNLLQLATPVGVHANANI